MRRLVITGRCVALYVAITALTGCMYYSYDADQFSGDATITDSGVRSAPPRWRITFPELPLDREGSYRFQVRGLPQHELFFILRPASDSMKAEIANSSAAVNVSVTDDRGNVVFRGGGPLNPFGLHWKHSEPQYEFYLSQVVSLVAYTTERCYTLEIVVTPADDSKSDLRVVPVLYGGGNELF